MDSKAKEMENLVLVRTKYEKLNRQEDKTKHDKKVRVDAVINGVKAQNRYKERQIQQLKHRSRSQCHTEPEPEPEPEYQQGPLEGCLIVSTNCNGAKYIYNL